MQGTQKRRNKKKNKAGKLTLPNFKTYHKANGNQDSVVLAEP